MPNIMQIHSKLVVHKEQRTDRRTHLVFSVRRFASTVYAVCVCPSVSLSVRLSQVSTAPKWLNVGLRTQRHTIAQEI